jgi:signal transduction histidine kinase
MPKDDAMTAARMRSLARLAAPTAHELRGALSALHLHLELLGGALDADDTAARERRQRYLRVLRAESGRLHRVTEAFLALAALPAGPADTDLAALVDGVVEAARPLATACRVRLEASYPGPVRVTVPEPEACRQRLLEVLLPALTEAPRGSSLCVDLAPDGRRATIAVEGAPRADVTLLGADEGADA